MFIQLLIKCKYSLTVYCVVGNQKTVHKVKRHAGKQVYCVYDTFGVFNLNYVGQTMDDRFDFIFWGGIDAFQNLKITLVSISCILFRNCMFKSALLPFY